jgi:hypothetical protein
VSGRSEGTWLERVARPLEGRVGSDDAQSVSDSVSSDGQVDVAHRIPRSLEAGLPLAEGSADLIRLPIHKYRSNDSGIDRESLWAYHAGALSDAMEAAKESRTAHNGLCHSSGSRIRPG